MRTLCLALLLVASAAGAAEARKSQTFRYPYSRVWAAAVRMLRVDYSSPITERAKDEGYFLFDFVREGERYPGSVELIPEGEKRDPQIQVVIQISALPSYIEQMLLNKLVSKLKSDYGPPREAPPEVIDEPDADDPDVPPDDEGAPKKGKAAKPNRKAKAKSSHRDD